MRPTLSLAATIRDVRDLLATAQNLAAVEQAHKVLRACETFEGEAVQLGYLYALACARSSAPGNAARIIDRLRAVAQGNAVLAADIESLAGRVAKDSFIATGDKKALQTAIAAYQRADQLQPSVYARINAASMLHIAGRATEAATLAAVVLAMLERDADADTHWDDATRGEAALLLGRIDEACAHYRDANRGAGPRFGDIASMRHQLLMLINVLPEARRPLAEIPGPNVFAFSGHMIDADDRQTPRFPARIESAVKDAIDQFVAASIPAIAYTQAACGSDILFCEAMLRQNQEVNIVLPFARNDYLAQSVMPGGAPWIARFERVVASATSITFATEERFLGDDTLFEHASNLIQGMAFLRAKELAVEPRMLVVADVSQGGAMGGTLATQSVWSSQAKAVDRIDLGEIRQRHRGEEAVPVNDGVVRIRPAQPTLAGGGRTIKSLLFADVKGFSRLAEEFFPTFFTTFLGMVPKTLREVGVTPLEISSRGDGLYAVFAEPEEAARFALALSDGIGAVDWVTMGLPAETHVRIALHAGPVFTATDPVTGTLAHYGAHVTRAARVEPVVIPGQVLVTEPFAAVLASRPGGGFVCDLVGTEPLAKDYGAARLYRLRQK